MSSSFQKATRLANRVFSRLNEQPISHEALAEVSGILRHVTAADLKLGEDILSDREAPVTYIRILETKVMSVGVFVLRHGRRIALHDHPNMFGILKVIHGTLTVNSYSTLDPSQHSIPDSVSDENPFTKQHTVPAKFEGHNQVSEKDPCCILTPEKSDIHEISSENGIAAFVDILAPPYYTDNRQCTYFKDISRDMDSVRYLLKILRPDDCWCDEEVYRGPVLTID